MKKQIIIACIAMAAIACNREMIPVENQPDSTRTITLTACIPDTKVSVASNGKVTWSSDDEIAVYNTDGQKFIFTVKSGAGTGNATFECSTFSGSIGDVAVYPSEWAGDTAGEIVIPEYIELSDKIPAVMASSVENGDGNEVAPLYFNSLMAIAEFTLKDVPAYACAFKLWSKSGAILHGTYTLNSTRDAFDSLPTGNSSQIIYFPYKTAYGPNATVKIYAAVPAYEYTDLAVRVLDGDEDVIEGTGKVIPSKNFSGIKANAYLQMPTLNIRSMVGSARDKFVKVEKVKWAKGNLRAWKSGGDEGSGNGWVEGWNVYKHQWDTQYALVNETVTGSSVSYSINSANYKEDNVYTHWDHFSWGTLGRASRVHNCPIICETQEYQLYNKVLDLGSATSGTITSATAVLTGDSQWVEIETFGSNNPTYAGDIAYWASKGQYRMPKSSEIVKLYSKAGETNERANMQAGYYMDGDKRINGLLFTSTPIHWNSAPSYNKEAIELTLADIESGLFLPSNGIRGDIGTSPGTFSATNVTGYNVWGGYWCGSFGGDIEDSNYKNNARCIGWKTDNALMYGYTVSISNSKGCLYLGNTKVGNCIRPVYNQ